MAGQSMAIDLHDEIFFLASFMWLNVIRFVTCRLRKPRDQKRPAICIDLDGTIWSDDDKQHVFAGVKESLKRMVLQGYSIFFVTARRESKREVTLAHLQQNLENVQYYSLYMRETQDTRSLDEYKKSVREEIQRNHDILLCIGDNVFDLEQNEDRACYNILIPKAQHLYI